MEFCDLHGEIKHIYGPQKIDYEMNELIVLSLVRDGESHIRSFIDHYLTLGAKHIVFLDNMSVDGTISIAKTYPNTTILQTKLSYKKYKYWMKQYLIRRFGRSKWSLYVDIDELFDYPFSDLVSLNSFLDYLNTASYTAVVAYMLDMFSDQPLSELVRTNRKSLKELYKFYDLSSIQKKDYSKDFCPYNVVSNEKISHYRGGIRKILFDADVSLTKHPLIFFDNKIKPMCNSSHRVEDARVADITCVLYHFKFVDNFQELVLRAVREESYFNNSQQYKQYQDVLQKFPDLVIQQHTSKELEHVNELVHNQFLLISDEYKKWVQCSVTGLDPF